MDQIVPTAEQLAYSYIIQHTIWLLLMIIEGASLIILIMMKVHLVQKTSRAGQFSTIRIL